MKVLVVVALLVAAAFAEFECPERDGFYADEEQCDMYYECVEGSAEQKLCPDGLFFNSERTNEVRCDNDFIVDCGNRVYIQEPTNPSPQCHRAYGYYAHNEGKCDVYFNCVNGIATEVPCPAKTYFDEERGICVNAANEDEYQAICGVYQPPAPDPGDEPEFSCPGLPVFQNGLKLAHPLYADEFDCAKFYVCFSGVRLVINGCPKPQVFNNNTLSCDEVENVPECAGWYDEDPIERRRR